MRHPSPPHGQRTGAGSVRRLCATLMVRTNRRRTGAIGRYINTQARNSGTAAPGWGAETPPVGPRSPARPAPVPRSSGAKNTPAREERNHLSGRTQLAAGLSHELAFVLGRGQQTDRSSDSRKWPATLTAADITRWMRGEFVFGNWRR